MKNLFIKTLMLKGEAGGTITKIEKIGVEGGSYVFRIHLSDGSTEDFEVDEVIDTEIVEQLIAAATPSIISQVADQTDSKIAAAILRMYPVGSIYFTTNNVNPATFLGGSWAAWGAGRVPVGVDTSDSDFDEANKSGGSKSNSYTPSGSLNGTVASHALGVDEIPSHSHVQWGRSDSISVQGGGSDGDYKAIYTAHMHVLPPTVTGGNTGLTGGGQGHSHDFSGSFNGDAKDISTIQPYITCYMWRRTA